MMKKYIMILLAAFLAYACADQEYAPAFQQYVGLNTTGLKNFSENGGSVKIPVIFGGDVSNPAAFNVSYTITGGTYGVNYTVDGGSSASGTVAFPAGALKENAVQFITIRGVGDFDIEDDVPLTITVSSVDRDVRIGFPYKDSYSFVINDDDCEFNFEGDLEGVDPAFPGADDFDADVTVVNNGGGEYTFDGISFAMIQGACGEAITAAAPTVVTVAPGGAITIEEQYIYTTDWQGSPYDYSIKGTGQVNYCDGTVTLTYDIFYSDGSGSVAAAFKDAEWMTTDLFVATLKPVAPDED